LLWERPMLAVGKTDPSRGAFPPPWFHVLASDIKTPDVNNFEFTYFEF